MDSQSLNDESMAVKSNDGHENGNLDIELCEVHQTNEEVLIDGNYPSKSYMYRRSDSRITASDVAVDDKCTAGQKCVQVNELNFVIIDKISVKSEKCLKDCNTKNQYVTQRVKSLERQINDLQTQSHHDKSRYELLRSINLLMELKLSESIEMNKMLEERIRNMRNTCCAMKNNVHTRNKEKLNRSFACLKNVLNLNGQIFMKQNNSNKHNEIKQDCECDRENSQNAEQKLQFARKIETSMKKIIPKFRKLKRMFTQKKSKNKEEREKSPSCTEQTQQETILKLNDGVCKNNSLSLNENLVYITEKFTNMEQKLQDTELKLNEEIFMKQKINDKHDKLKNEWMCVCEKLENTTQKLSRTEQKLQDTEFSLKEEIYMYKEIHGKYNQLSDEWKGVCKQLHNAEDNLQITLYELNKERNMKEKITDKFGEVKQDWMSARLKLLNTIQILSRMELQFKLKLNEEICMKQKINGEHDKLKDEWKYVCEKLKNTTEKLTRTEQKYQDIELKLNEEIYMNKKIQGEYNQLTDKWKSVCKKLHIAEENLQITSCELKKERNMKKKMTVKFDKVSMIG